jgi:hypothetical protein
MLAPYCGEEYPSHTAGGDDVIIYFLISHLKIKITQPI